jgi:excisionase family DNA binding protein
MGEQARSAPAFYSVGETAKIMRIDESTMYRHLRNGTFPAVKIGGRYVVPHVVLERLISDVLATGRCVDVAEWTARCGGLSSKP